MYWASSCFQPLSVSPIGLIAPFTIAAIGIMCGLSRSPKIWKRICGLSARYSAAAPSGIINSAGFFAGFDFSHAAAESRMTAVSLVMARGTRERERMASTYDAAEGGTSIREALRALRNAPIPSDEMRFSLVQCGGAGPGVPVGPRAAV